MTSDGLLVREALASYFRDQGLGENGGVNDAWVPLRLGRFRFAFPNFAARRAAVRYHDVHHLATGYDTRMQGEALIGAWEIGAGCGTYWVAWLLDSGALAGGALWWPRETFAAFRRGQVSRSLYHEPFEPVLDERLDALRARLGLDRALPPATPGQRLAFGGWALLGLSWMLAPLIVVGMVAAMLV